MCAGLMVLSTATQLEGNTARGFCLQLRAAQSGNFLPQGCAGCSPGVSVGATKHPSANLRARNPHRVCAQTTTELHRNQEQISNKMIFARH